MSFDINLFNNLWFWIGFGLSLFILELLLVYSTFLLSYGIASFIMVIFLGILKISNRYDPTEIEPLFLLSGWAALGLIIWYMIGLFYQRPNKHRYAPEKDINDFEHSGIHGIHDKVVHENKTESDSKSPEK